MSFSRHILSLTSALLMCGSTAYGIVSVTDPIDPADGGSGTVWYPIISGTNDDFNNDQQTGNTSSDSDIVGDIASNQAAFYGAFDDAGSASNTDGTLGFRLRLSGGSGTDEGFGSFVFIGLELNGDTQIDMYIGIDAKSKKVFDGDIGFYEAQGGATANVSPSTTDIAKVFDNGTVSPDSFSAANYNYQAVTGLETGLNSDIGADGTDYFLTVSLDFADLVAAAGLLANPISVTDETEFGFVVGTSTQANAFNQDINGINKADANSDLTWEELADASGGGLSPRLNTDGSIVPEPSSYALILGMLIGAVGCTRRRR